MSRWERLLFGEGRQWEPGEPLVKNRVMRLVLLLFFAACLLAFCAYYLN